MSFLQRIKKLFKTRKVLVHTPTGDVTLEVHKGDIIRVPWAVSWSHCPFRLEPDGTVTLRLMWGETPAKGYRKIKLRGVKAKARRTMGWDYIRCTRHNCPYGYKYFDIFHPFCSGLTKAVWKFFFGKRGGE